MRVLVLSNVWVEPRSSAAGSRMLQLLQLFLAQGWTVTYASTASESAYAFDLSSLGIETVSVQINDASFDAFAKKQHPNIVLFDRFMVEEQLGWRIAQHCPDALRILDTEDLHCLRKARQLAIKENRDFEEQDLQSDVAKREIASIYRCDLTLMISLYEMDLLQSIFKVPSPLLHYIPFLMESPSGAFPTFEEREHFVSIGNFLHPPNWDAVRVLKEHIWPKIRKELPEAQLNIYGAYPSEKVHQLHNEKEGFLVTGRAEDARKVISQASVLVAPLRFGAGLKGKFFDAMQTGTPSVTTTIGAEGIAQDLEWCGTVEDDFSAFAKACIQLYTNTNLWNTAQKNGLNILQQNFDKKQFEQPLIAAILRLHQNLEEHRASNFTGQMLHHHLLQSTKYMSKWIEAKNAD